MSADTELEPVGVTVEIKAESAEDVAEEVEKLDRPFFYTDAIKF